VARVKDNRAQISDPLDKCSAMPSGVTGMLALSSGTKGEIGASHRHRHTPNPAFRSN